MVYSMLGEQMYFLYWTVRDFYTLGEEFMYVAVVQKVDKKVRY